MPAVHDVPSDAPTHGAPNAPSSLDPSTPSRRAVAGWTVTAGGAIFLVGLLLPWLEVAWTPSIQRVWTPLQLGYQHAINAVGELDVACGVAMLLYGIVLLSEPVRSFRTITATAGALVVAVASFVALVAQWRFFANDHVTVSSGTRVIPYIASGFWVSLLAVAVVAAGAIIGISAVTSVSRRAFVAWLVHPARQPGAAEQG